MGVRGRAAQAWKKETKAKIKAIGIWRAVMSRVGRTEVNATLFGVILKESGVIPTR